MQYSFKQYEDAIINALSPLKQDEGGYLRVLKAYSGELEAENVLEYFVRNFPAVLVKIVEASYEPADLASTRQTITVNLLVCARSYRIEESGDNVGVYKILEDIRNILIDNKCGLLIRPLVLAREWEFGNTQDLVFYVAEYLIINDNA